MAQTACDPRAWTATTVESPVCWYSRLTTHCLDVIGEKIQSLTEDQPITDLWLSPEECAAVQRDLEGVRRELEEGRGFVVLEGVPLERCSARQATAAYWLIGQGLGVPLEQNVQGTLLYDVRDTGQELAQGARFSVTSYESSFHTDNSFGETVLDIVGLFCLQTARSGGRSQIVSAYSACRLLGREHPEALAVLGRPVHFDRRGGVRTGQAPTIQFPIVEETERGLLLRYLRYWIEAGHQKADVPLTEDQVSALDLLDEVLRRSELRVEFDLQRGQMLFLNNRWLLHNRTAFEDHQEPQRRRHLVRLWLRSL